MTAQMKKAQLGFTSFVNNVLLLWIFYGFFSVLCSLCLCARLFICALWSPAGKGLTSLLSFVVSYLECHFPIGILDQVRHLIVSIPDFCILTYFRRNQIKKTFKIYLANASAYRKFRPEKQVGHCNALARRAILMR